MARFLGVGLLALAGMGAAAHAQAQAVADDHGDEDRWSFRLTPYVWGTATDGTFGHEWLPFELHSSKRFSDALDELDVGAMGLLEARKGRYGVVADGQFTKLATTLEAPIAGARLPVLLKTRVASGLLAFRYGLRESDTGNLDLIAGVRVWQARVRMAYAIPVPVPPPIPQRYNGEQRRTWADLQIGLKGRHAFANGTFVGGWALAGAGESNLSTDVMLLTGYRIDARWAVLLGYRWMSTDFKTRGGFAFDTAMRGPGLGVEYQF
ncbi:hypothetical protein [Stenotrophomonas sp.]|uniref:hypothetical protein n=1 Tax=Stenotrophomonas sp. TaxID=69392 RepID=UPI002FC5F763